MGNPQERLAPPSFTHKVREMLTKREVRAQAGQPDHRFRITLSKLGTYAFLDRLKVPHAQVRAIVPLEGITTDHLAGGAVIKPLDGRSSIGFAVVRPDGEHWVHLHRGWRWTFDELIGWLGRSLRRLGTPDRWIIEERLEPPAGHPLAVVDDVKVYAFRGEIGLVLMRRRTARQLSYRWFDADLAPVDTGKYPSKVDHDLELPAETGEALQLASRISRAAPFPFLRVDTLITNRGVLVGELNSHVGRFGSFNDDWDHRLGEMWERSEALMNGARARPIPAQVVAGEYPERRWRVLAG